MQSISLEPSGNNALKTPLYLYATVLSSVSIIVGLIWDISWHMSIGRDGLFSAPHLAIYFGGIVAGIFSGIRVLKITFAGTETERNESVKFWGIFYGSLGALFCIWGAFAMLTSAPFDDWWHAAYGLDVQILSPPHTVLALGMITIQFGAMVSVLARQNRYAKSELLNDAKAKKLNILFALSSGFFLVMLFTIASEYLGRNDMHSTIFYQVSGLLFPLTLIAFSVSAKSKWGAAQASIVYMIFMMIMVWVLPLFPAEPRLGPVLNHITNFQAFKFPLLLVIPALAIDWITQRYSDKNKWMLAIFYAIAFVIIQLAVHWPFGNFLMSEYSRNWFFGSTSWYFGSDPTWEYRYVFAPWQTATGVDLVIGLSIALVIAILSSRLALTWGNWMKKVVR